MSSLTPTAATEIFRQAPDRFVEVEHGEVALRTLGSGPDVLFVHGWPVSGATFRLLLPHLVDHVTCHVIDLPGTGQSRFDGSTEVSFPNHIASVTRTVDALGLDSIAVVGHDSGGMIARHAMAGDSRLRSMGLVNTEIPGGNSWRFNSFARALGLPGFAKVLGWAAGKPAVRRNKFVLGDAFADKRLLDGDFDEFFLRPLANDPTLLAATGRIARTFSLDDVRALTALHRKIDVPVVLVWGDQDPFFPIKHARTMVDEFSNASMIEIPGAGLFSHEEAPEQVAAALLPTLTNSTTD